MVFTIYKNKFEPTLSNYQYMTSCDILMTKNLPSQIQILQISSFLEGGTKLKVNLTDQRNSS